MRKLILVDAKADRESTIARVGSTELKLDGPPLSEGQVGHLFVVHHADDALSSYPLSLQPMRMIYSGSLCLIPGQVAIFSSFALSSCPYPFANCSLYEPFLAITSSLTSRLFDNSSSFALLSPRVSFPSHRRLQRWSLI